MLREMPRSPTDFRTLVTELRRARGMSLEDVAFEARQHAPPGTAVSLSLIQKRLAPGSTKRPSAAMLEALAAALKVEPAVFVEYRLARAREKLDEEVLGLAAAERNLSRIETALEAGPPARAAKRAQPKAPSQQPTQEAPHGDRQRDRGGRRRAA